MRYLIAFLFAASFARAAVTCPAGVAHCAQISWTAPASGGTPTGYNIYRSSVNNGCAVLTATTCKKVGSTPTLLFLDSPLAAATTYYWVVTATDATSESLGTPQASGTSPNDALGQPGSIIIQIK